MGADWAKALPLPEAATPGAESGGGLPHAYQAVDPARRGPIAEARPRNAFLEITNRCNSACVTCPRTFMTFEPPKTVGWTEFAELVARCGYASRSAPAARRAGYAARVTRSANAGLLANAAAGLTGR